MVYVQFLPLRSCVSFVLFSMTKREFLFVFGLKIFKRLLPEAHVFGRCSIFCFVFNDRALTLLRHVVELSLSVTNSRAAETN